MLAYVPLFGTIFILTLILIPIWIKMARKASLTGKDIHKTSQKQVAEMGGAIVLLAFTLGILSYIAIRIFIFESSGSIAQMLGMLTAILLAGLIGIIDDILGWKIGLRQWQKPLLTLLVALPIMALNAGTSTMSIPFIGSIDFGLIYPLIIIPLFILGGSNGFNMLAGYNGLEAGLGMIIMATLGTHAYLTGTIWITVAAFVMFAALAAFLFYNHYPAKIFPGDSLTYTVGALAAMIAIFGNIERAFIILFIPYGIEFLLKLRGMFQKESFAQVQPDQTLKPRYKRIYGLENLTVLILNKLNIRTTETKVVYTLYGFQSIFVIITFLLI